MALGLKKKASKSSKRADADKRKLSAQGHAPVNDRRQSFIDHYMITRSATKAAKLAGYSVKTAHAQGSRLLKDVDVAAEVARRDAIAREKLEITADRVKEEVAKVAFGNVAKFIKIGADGAPYVDFSGASDDDMAALQAVTIEEFKDGRSDKREVRRVKVTLGDKSGNLKNLMQHFGLMKEVVQHNHTHDLSVMELMLREIEEARRGPKTIEHE